MNQLSLFTTEQGGKMKKLQLFISYSHKDDTYRLELDKWLVNLKEKGLIESWHDGNLLPGDPLVSKIYQKIDEADIILLLLSQDYLYSKACKEEMEYALRFSQKKKIVPIILKDCTWKETGCRDLLALPKDGIPVAKWATSEEAWLNIYDGIKKVAEELQFNFEIINEFLEEIQQIEFVTQSKKGTTLSDIFVFPNISVDKDAFKKENIEYDFFLEKKKKSILIKGREFSGKTALLKWLYTSLREKYTTLLLNGNNIHKTLDFDEYFRGEFSKQMNGNFNNWMKLENKVVLIDNFNHNISHNIIAYLNENFVMTIIALDDEEYMLYFKDEPSFSDYTTLTLGQFNLVQQEGLIKKWRQESRSNNLTEINDLDIDKIEARVNNVITAQKIVPRYPFYILSILQSLESFMPSDYRITAYGHCYQALVTAQLIKKNIKPEDLDTCFNYLKNLSYDIYDQTKDGKTYTKKEYLHFRDTYKSRFIITEALINKIENEDYPILDIQGNYVRFEHSYIYYFFLGMHLASIENITIIDDLCKKIHLKQNAFILIFTIHHTQSRDLLDTIRLHCVYSFENVPPAELSTEETKFMNNLIASLPQSIISNKSTEQNRIEQRKNKEANNDDQNDVSEDEEANKDVSIMEINRGIRIMEVLGQILKNRAGSFEKKDVEEILENTVDLGLRILNLFLSEYRKPEFKEWLIKLLEDAEKRSEIMRNRKFDNEKRISFIEKAIQFFGYVVTIGMLNRIFEAVTTDKLTEIMQLLSEKKSSPAYELINHLVASSQNGINVNHVKFLLEKYDKKKNYWAEKALSYYVQNYLNTHNINYKDRQRLFKALDIKYLPNKT